MFDLPAVGDTLFASAVGDVADLSGEELLASAAGLERLRTLLDASELRVLAELEARGTCDVVEGLSTKGWLARDTQASTFAAGRRVVCAKALRAVPGFELVFDALVDGLIGFDHVDVLVRASNPRIRDEFAVAIPELLALAGVATFGSWQAAVLAAARLLDQDGAYDPAADPASNTMSIRPVLDGLTDVRMTLTPEHAAVFDQVVNDHADRIFKRAVDDHDVSGGELAVPERGQLLVEAMLELLRAGVAAINGTGAAASPEVSLVIPTDQTRPDGGAVVYDRNAVRFADGTVDHLLCDAFYRAFILDALGVPLDMGRGERFATRNQRRAMRIRDGGCVFPGCDAPFEWCDAHHLDHWTRDEGETNVDRMYGFCRHHHCVIHRKGWKVETLHDGYLVITTPTGKTLHSQRHGRRRPDAGLDAARQASATPRPLQPDRPRAHPPDTGSPPEHTHAA